MGVHSLGHREVFLILCGEFQKLKAWEESGVEGAGRRGCTCSFVCAACRYRSLACSGLMSPDTSADRDRRHRSWAIWGLLYLPST